MTYTLIQLHHEPSEPFELLQECRVTPLGPLCLDPWFERYPPKADIVAAHVSMIDLPKESS